MKHNGGNKTMSWYTVKDIAGMPGVGGCGRTVRRQASRENWQWQERRGVGGGREYHISSLPALTRMALANRAAVERHAHTSQASLDYVRSLAVNDVVDNKVQADGVAEYARLADERRAASDIKLTVINAIDRHIASSNKSPTAATAEWCQAFNTGKITLENIGNITTISARTVIRWRQTAKQQGIQHLAGHYGNRRGSGRIDSQPELYRFATAMLVAHPHINAPKLRRAIQTRFADTEVQLPGAGAVRRWLENWKADNKQLYTAIVSPDKYKSNYMPAFGNADEHITRLNQLWELDSTPADLMLTDGRHSIVSVIDVWSRRAKMVVSKTSTAAAVASAVRRAILDWGKPEIVRIDNGADYKSHHMMRVYHALGIEPDICAPFSGWQKGYVERFQQTFLYDLVELLPGYCGHSVAQKREIEDRKAFADRIMTKGEVIDVALSSAELQDFCDRWLKNIYECNVHSGIGTTPALRAAGQPAEAISDPRVLDILLANGGTRTVGKKGIRFEGGTYIAPELGDWIGDKVMCLYDSESDIGELIVFGGPDNEFICIAQDPDITGISRQAVAAETRARRTHRVEDAKRELKKAARKEKAYDIAHEIMASREEQARKITHLPGPTTDYDSPTVRSARAAADARDGINNAPEAAPVSEEDINQLRDTIRQEQQHKEDAEDRFRRWIDLHSKQQAGETLNDLDAQWLRHYTHPDNAEFTGRKLIYDDFGPGAFGVRD